MKQTALPGAATSTVRLGSPLRLQRLGPGVERSYTESGFGVLRLSVVQI
jgi:hypothetical protein